MTHFSPTIETHIDLLLNSAHAYSQLARVKSDLVELCRQFPSLLLRSGPFAKDNITLTLVYLTGTIPSVYFRDNNVYNIPVTIYITEAYPFEPPVVFVTPSATMVLSKSHPFVDLNSGRYINQLLQKWAVHNTLVELARVLQKEFGENPPVRSRRDPPPPPPYHTTPTPTPPHFTTPSVIPAQPQFPSGYPGLVHTSPMTSSHSQYLYPPPPIPAPPPPTVVTPPITHVTPPVNSPSTSSYSVPYYDNSRSTKTTTTTTTTTTEPTKVRSPPTQKQPNDEEETLRIFLQHKVQTQLQEFMETATQEIEKEMSRSNALEAEAKQIEKEKLELLLKREQIENTITNLEKQTEELQKWIEKNSKLQEELDVDQLTEPKDPLKRQILRLQAEDLAIEDCQYALNKALESGQTDLTTHLKLTRQLAREQFFKRALIAKLTSHSSYVLKTVPTSNSSNSK